jgi:hypothetical protein
MKLDWKEENNEDACKDEWDSWLCRRWKVDMPDSIIYIIPDVKRHVMLCELLFENNGKYDGDVKFTVEITEYDPDDCPPETVLADAKRICEYVYRGYLAGRNDTNTKTTKAFSP